MRYNGENLNEVLDAHEKWVLNKDGQSDETGRADFHSALLCDADLMGRNLVDANFEGAILIGANLSYANLSSANFTRAILRKATLTHAILRDASFDWADLTEASMIDACLTRATFRFAILNDADLSFSDLYFANFYTADIYHTNFDRADCNGALFSENLGNAKRVPFIPMACPDSGDFIGWKKCTWIKRHGQHHQHEYVIVKLLIPADAKRSSATGRKCRASYAKVLEVQTFDGTVLNDACPVSLYDPTFTYIPGEEVRPKKPFDENRWQECTDGIHFFINRTEAVNYGNL